ncbi:phosphoglycerol transferase MdoB-like AlkP superfamily enzyme [Microbacterium sp. W4I4]|uniref:mechanosensitive ion channel family protein n=1 Tax=Microbacterium sp. W4I4 TaxID=3042295 RepID=UPI00278A7E26|nr:hypothetical protein [Microbacterium sp. W4I4]MDQ0613550.1 phosphoglycerol transferase MdoB-like AlkP superfamily enzyme [Microbacterium sp. W4I4]
MDWPGLGVMLAGIGNFILQLIVFLIILLIGWLIAKSIAKGLEFLFKRLGFQKMLDKAGISRLLAPTGIDPLTLVVKLVYYFILLIALLLALGAFGPSNPVSGIVEDIIGWLPRLFVAIVIIIVVAAIANFVGDIMRPALAKFRFGAVLTRVVTIAIIAMGVIAALNQIGVAVTVTMPILIAVLAALVGIAVVGIGGGLITPMRSRWEHWLGSMESELASPSALAAPSSATSSAASAPSTAADGPHTPPAPPAPPQV